MRSVLLASMLGLSAMVMNQALAQSPDDFDAYVEQVRSAFDIPGIAVGVIKDGKLVLAKGYGLRDTASGQPVSADTLFAIASNTKAFTAVSLQMLAEDGKLKMEDRVVDHLPWFQMSDPYVTREMRVRDLLAHRSGLSLGAGDLLYWPTTSYSGREVVERLRHVPLKGGFRDKYAYDNILYGVAQQVIEQVSGQSYEQFLQARIFAPLGMQHTRYNAGTLQAGDEVATGYAKADFTKLQPAPRMTWSNVAGAGGIYSSVNDLAKWVRVQLDGGLIEGEGDAAKRLFPESRQREMWSMLTPIAVPKPSVPELADATPNFAGYGEGWSLSDFRGQKLVWHTGGWPGMVSRITLVPGKKLGVIVLTNQEVGAAFNAITLRAIDDALGLPAVDWIDAYAKALAKQKGSAEESWAKRVAARNTKSKPSLPLANYAGTYRDAWYGDVNITMEQGKPMLRFSRTAELVGELEHWQHDTFIVRWRERWLNADAFVNFDLNEDGKVTAAKMKALSPLTDFSFDFHDLDLRKVEPKKP